ncbi:MAG: methyl-accepting chemotaxis protein [Methylovulum sp.]|nr:methyl-accepting chemotaxis protein [Methylovulum sp.]
MSLKNMPIKHKLLLMLVLPMLGIVGFSSLMVVDKYARFSMSKQLIQDSDFFAEIGAVVHNLQKERGTTVGFISSHGAKMADKLPGLRTDSDKSIQPLLLDINARIAESKAGIANTVTQLSQLKTLRQQADAFAIDGLSAAAQYTAVIQSLLELSNNIGKVVKDDEIMRGANTYSAYLNMKERAGRERAVMSGIFAIDKLDRPHLLSISANLGEYNANLSQFTQIATPEQIAFHAKTVSGSAVDEVERLRKHTLQSPLDSALGVDSNYWFDMATLRINAMKKVEDKLVADLQASADAIETNALTALMVNLIGTAIVFMGTFILVRLITRAITQPLTMMKDIIVDVDKTGDFSKTIHYQAEDEIGQTAQAFNNMLASLQTALQETNSVMDALEKGDFNVRIHANVNGDLKRLKATVNSTVEELALTIAALNQAMQALRNGDFSTRVDTHVKGEFKNAVDNAVSAEKAMQAMFGDIGRVMGRIAVGDISHRVTVEGRGELALLKDNINLTLDALNSLNDIVRVADALAQGDLTQSIHQNYPGIFGAVTSSINHTADNLKQLIGKIHGASAMINTAAKEIAAGNNDLSHRTEEQAASLEQTTASMQELTSAVRQNNAHASHVNDLAGQAAAIATRGVSAVDSVVATMDNINQSSHRIVEIISVIDDIAFQTNILALNAAVEAARAGDQGKGFAVVATEVRNLAQRAGNAASEIKRLINDSVEKVNNGSQLVSTAGQTMDEIVHSIRNVTTIIAEITAASAEQTAGIGQVNQAIRQMDDVTQQNAALVEQAAAAAESLEDQTHDLSLSLGTFKI